MSKDETPRGAYIGAFIRNMAAVLAATIAILTVGWKVGEPHIASWLTTQVGAGIGAQVKENTEAVQLVGTQVAENAQAIAEFAEARALEAATQRDMRETLASIAETQNKMAETLSSAVDRLASLEERKKADASPVMRFIAGSTISDGPIGGFVEMTWRFFKLRDGCGPPRVELVFRNGGNRLHRFTDVSSLDERGRGIGYPANPSLPYSLTYLARIPADDGVEPGRAVGWNRITYPECPEVRPEISAEIPFVILAEPPPK